MKRFHPNMRRKAKHSHHKRDPFLASREWRVLRMVVLKKYGARCQCCGASAVDGVRINVDHIKPRRRFPDLALTESNLQVLCATCNAGKGNWDQSDWRPESRAIDMPKPRRRERAERPPLPGPRLVPKQIANTPISDELMTDEQACKVLNRRG